MLPDGKALNKVVLGKNGLINTIKKIRFSLIVHQSDYNSTIKSIKSFQKCEVFRCSSFWRVVGAQNASLTIMVGGNINGIRQIKKNTNLYGQKSNSCWSKWNRTNSKSL